MAASTDSLHEHAMKAEEHTEQLATGLAEVGADPAAVKAITQCASILRKVGKALAKGGTADEPEAQPEPAQGGDRMGQALDEHMAANRPPA